MLVDMRPADLTGAEASEILDKVGITVNKNSIPFDTEPIVKTGGIRVGTPAITTREMQEKDMDTIAHFIDSALTHKNSQNVLQEIRTSVIQFTSQFPLP